MLRILSPGRPVPRWLQHIEADASENLAVVVGRLTLVYAAGGEYRCRPLLPGGKALFVIRGKATNLRIAGQSPKNGQGGVLFLSRPILGWPELGALAALVLAALLALAERA